MIPAAAGYSTGFLVLIAAAGLGGWAGTFPGRSAPPSIAACIAAGLGIGAIALAALGWCGLAYPAAGWSLAVLGGVGLLRTGWPRPRAGVDLPGPDWTAAVVIVPAGLAVGLALVPPTVYDTVSYHLVLPQQAALCHKVTAMRHFLPAAFPFVAQGGYGWAWLLGGGWRGAAMVNASCALLGAALTARLGAALGLDAVSRWIAAAVWLAIPMVQTVASTPLADLQVLVYSLLAVCAVLERPRARRAWLAAGWWAGLAGACKYQAVLIALPLVAAAAWLGSGPAPKRRRLVALAAGALPPLAVIWLKNFAFLGDPVYPFLTPGAVRTKLMAGLSGHYAIERTLWGAASLPARLAWPGTQAPFAREIWEVGPVSLALYALPWLAWRERGRRPRLAAVAAGSLAVYLTGFAMSWQMRHFMAVLAILACVWVAAAERVRGGRAIVLAALLLGSAPAWPRVIAPFRLWAAHGLRTAAYLEAFGGPSTLWPYRACVWLRTHTPPTARVLCVFEPQALWAERRLETSLMNDRSLLEDELEAASDADELARRLRRKGIGWLLVCNGLPPDHAAFYFKDISNRGMAMLKELVTRTARTRFGAGGGLYLVQELPPPRR